MIKGVYKSDPRHEGVIFHYWEPLSNKCSAHLINTYLTNPNPSILPSPLLPSPLLQSSPIPQSSSIQSLPTLYRPILSSNRPLSFTHHRPIVLPLPLLFHNTIPHTIYPYTTLYIPQNTHHTQFISIPKASFCHKKSIFSYRQIFKNII